MKVKITQSLTVDTVEVGDVQNVVVGVKKFCMGLRTVIRNI